MLQRGFIKAYEGLSSFNYINEKATTSWLFRIVVNEALQFLREQKRLTLSEDVSEPQTLVFQAPDVEDEMAYEACFRLVRNLPDGYRTVFNLYVIEGYSHKEISQMLNISESASRSQLTRARGILQAKLKSLNYATEFAG